MHPGRCVLAAAIVAFVVSAAQQRFPRTYCARGNGTCWPTAADVTAFRAALDEGSIRPARNLTWRGLPHPQILAVPVSSPGFQPLYGLGAYPNTLRGLYHRTDDDVAANHTCFDLPADPLDGYASDNCKAALRNLPRDGWRPAFTVFVQNAAQAATALAFAVRHDLCVMVASTGHEYNNRHSCPPDGVFIRTALMKDKEFLPANRAPDGPSGSPHGAFRLGPGNIFSEVQAFAKSVGRAAVSGWCPSVGIVGFSLGGGHATLAPKFGLGADQIVEVELLVVRPGNSTARPTVAPLTVNARENTELGLLHRRQ